MKHTNVTARSIATLLAREPRGFHQGALLAGAAPMSETGRRKFIAAKVQLRAELDTVMSGGNPRG